MCAAERRFVGGAICIGWAFCSLCALCGSRLGFSLFGVGERLLLCVSDGGVAACWQLAIQLFALCCFAWVFARDGWARVRGGV